MRCCFVVGSPTVLFSLCSVVEACDLQRLWGLARVPFGAVLLFVGRYVDVCYFSHFVVATLRSSIE